MSSVDPQILTTVLLEMMDKLENREFLCNAYLCDGKMRNYGNNHIESSNPCTFRCQCGSVEMGYKALARKIKDNLGRDKYKEMVRDILNKNMYLLR